MSPFNELVERLEKATGPDRELDCLIAVHPDTPKVGVVKSEAGAGIVAILLEPRATGIHEPDVERALSEYLPETNADYMGVPYYTASLDAALTLVPEGWRCTHAYWATDESDPGATFNFTLPQSLTGKPSVYASGTHKKIALALCIAALKARTPTGETE